VLVYQGQDAKAAAGELCEFGFACRIALAREVVEPLSLRSVLAEGAGFARILLDLTECFQRSAEYSSTTDSSPVGHLPFEAKNSKIPISNSS
jgi:hypothetical protein